MTPWQSQALCRGDEHPTALFYPDAYTPDAVADAVAVCIACPVRTNCLDYAITYREPEGIWGATTPEQRRNLRRVRNQSPDRYEARIEAAAKGAGSPVFYHPAGPCPRCGINTPAQWAPEDRNGPAAECGRASTYNRGCRCVPCLEAKREAKARARSFPRAGNG